MPLIAYWNIRGLAQPVRVLLGYAEEDFEDKLYEVGVAPDFSRDSWLKEKFSLGLEFPNLPYYIDGDTKLCQSNAIMRHLARKHNLMGKTDAEKDRCDMAAEQVIDFRSQFTRTCYGRMGKEAIPNYLDKLTDVLMPFETFLGESDWLAGASLTWADFIFWEMLDQHLLFKPGCLDALPKLKAYHQQFKDVPQIKKFMTSEKFFQGQCNGSMALWGGSYPVAPAE